MSLITSTVIAEEKVSVTLSYISCLMHITNATCRLQELALSIIKSDFPYLNFLFLSKYMSQNIGLIVRLLQNDLMETQRNVI